MDDIDWMGTRRLTKASQGFSEASVPKLRSAVTPPDHPQELRSESSFLNAENQPMKVRVTQWG